MGVKLTPKQFALAWGGKSASYVTTYIGRKKIVKTGKYIELDNPVNVMFLQELKAKGQLFDLNRVTGLQSATQMSQKSIKSNDTGNISNEVDMMSFEDLKALELAKKEAELNRIQISNELNQLKIKKHSGELIPFESAKFAFIRSLQIFKAQFKATSESILNISINSTVNYHTRLKEMHNEINRAYDESIELLKKELDTIAKEASEQYERGEKRS
ncbi:MAG: hypothetical protein HC831_22475 [Chloroflexia bacterium]|nr:hypothetical protein [Chloroflexia bacterium]